MEKSEIPVGFLAEIPLLQLMFGCFWGCKRTKHTHPLSKTAQKERKRSSFLLSLVLSQPFRLGNQPKTTTRADREPIICVSFPLCDLA